MNPGKMKDQLKVQRAKKEQLRSGGYKIVGWENVEGILWGSVKSLAPESDKIASIDTRKALYDIVIRQREITTENRLLWRGKILEIDFIDDDPSKGPPFYLTLRCKEARSV